MRVEMRGIVKRFGETTALNAVDLDLRAAEIHAILGENGAGKSTLMHVLSGAMRADRGEILIDGRPVRIDSPRTARRMGVAMVHQHFALVPAFTVAENLALDADPGACLPRPLRYSPAAAAAPALDRAKSLGWSLDPSARVDELPVGAQQRVEIAKGLSTEARVLIFDEPTAVLDAGEVDELFTMLRRLREEGRSVVLIAHKLAEILAVADRVTVLRQGNRVTEAPRSEVDARRLAGWMMGVVPADTSSVQAPATGPADTTGLAPATGPAATSATRVGPALEAADIVILGDRGERAIRGVSLRIARGEIFGIGGVDGNGQVELAEALVGLRSLHGGAIRWESGEFKPGTRPRTGYVPQDRRRSGLAVTMTVEENLIMNACGDPRFRRGPFLRRRELRRLASDLVAQFDIRSPGLNHAVSTLSGGNQQKIVVARALHAEPELLIAVNPTRGLDIGATRFVREQLRQARDRGAAVLLISTDLDELAALSDRAAILSGGELAEYRIRASAAEEVGLMLGGVAVAASPLSDAGGRA
jgi:general nucleoside transport system ATP-binding protein